MEHNSGIEPRLVEIDNLGSANSNPAPYTLLWWMQQILNAIGSGDTGIPFDYQSNGYVDVDTSGYTPILTINLTPGDTLNIKNILVSLQGNFGHFKVEYFDGTTTTVFREYYLNAMQHTFSDIIPTPIAKAYVNTGSKITISTKMISVGQLGKAYCTVNGFK